MLNLIFTSTAILKSFKNPLLPYSQLTQHRSATIKQQLLSSPVWSPFLSLWFWRSSWEGLHSIADTGNYCGMPKQGKVQDSTMRMKSFMKWDKLKDRHLPVATFIYSVISVQFLFTRWVQFKKPRYFYAFLQAFSLLQVSQDFP